MADTLDNKEGWSPLAKGCGVAAVAAAALACAGVCSGVGYGIKQALDDDNTTKMTVTDQAQWGKNGTLKCRENPTAESPVVTEYEPGDAVGVTTRGQQGDFVFTTDNCWTATGLGKEPNRVTYLTPTVD